MSSQQINREVQQDLNNLRRTEQYSQQTLVSGETHVVTNTEQSIATEVPIVTEKVITKEYVPVTYEKVIQMIPVVVGQRVETGAPVSQEKYVQAMNVEYVQGVQQTTVDLTPQMSTQFIGSQQVVNQPLNMPAEKISQQTFNQTTYQTQPVLTQQTLTTSGPVIEAQHYQPGQGFLGQQGVLGQGQPGLQGQQGILGQAGYQQTGNLSGQQNFIGQQPVGQNFGQKSRNIEGDLKNIEKNVTGGRQKY